MEEIKKKEFYRDAVKKRNNEIIEEKKNKTLWRLDKIQLMNSPQKFHHGRGRSEDGLERAGSGASY